jgi:hypothetical protein
VALDARPSELSNGLTANYLVTNDQWRSVTNRHLKVLAKSLVKHGPRDPPNRVHRYVVVAALAIATFAPLLFWLARSRPQHRSE